MKKEFLFNDIVLHVLALVSGHVGAALALSIISKILWLILGGGIAFVFILVWLVLIGISGGFFIIWTMHLIEELY